MKKRKKIRKPDRRVPVPDVMMNRTTRQKLLKAIAEPQRTPGAGITPRLPALKSYERIVLTGLVHMESGESLGRELAFCTAHQSESTFFLSPEDMVGPDSDGDRAAQCPLCITETGLKERHWVEDFRTALFQGLVQTQEAGYIVEPVALLKNLLKAHGSGPLAKPAGPTAPPARR